MKLAALPIALLIVGCSFAPNQESLIKKALEENFVPQMDDPGSYEFVEIEAIDTLTNNEYRKNIIEGNTSSIEMYSGFMSSDEDLLKMYQRYPKDPYYQKQVADQISEIEENKAKIASYQRITDSLTVLLPNSDSSGIVRINTIVKIRGNNKMGAKILSRFAVAFDGNMKFIQAEHIDN